MSKKKSFFPIKRPTVHFEDGSYHTLSKEEVATVEKFQKAMGIKTFPEAYNKLGNIKMEIALALPKSAFEEWEQNNPLQARSIRREDAKQAEEIRKRASDGTKQ